MERPAPLFSEEALGEFLYLKELLSGTKTPSEYMKIIIDGYKRNKRQKEYFYAGIEGANDRIEGKLKKIREEIRAHLRQEQPKFPAQKPDTRFIYDSMLVAEANELTEGNFENPKEKIEVRLAGFGLNIDNLDLNVEIG